MNKEELVGKIVDYWKANVGRVDVQFKNGLKRKKKADLEKFAKSVGVI